MKKYQFSILLFLATATLMAQSLSGKHHIKYLEINTVQSDYGTTFLEEDRVVFTTPTDDKSKNSQLDLYVGEIGNEGEIVKKERVKGLIGSKISKTGIKNIGSAIELMAEAEGLKAHKNAVTLRLKELNNN